MKYLIVIIFLSIGIATTAQTYKLDGNQVVVSAAVTFKGNTATLTKEGTDAVLIIKRYLDDKKYISLLRIEGNVAIQKNSEANQQLSAQRAKAVYETLVNAGVPCKRLVAVAFGDTKPVVALGETNSGLQNTYIKFINVSLNNRVIGSLPIDGGGVVVPVNCVD